MADTDLTPFDPLPSWARTGARRGSEPAPASLPGWWSTARRWLQVPAPGEGESAGTRPPAVAAAPAAATPPAPGWSGQGRQSLHERLRRCGSHAVRHPGFGYALLHLELALADDDARRAGPRAAEAWRNAERRLQATLRPGDALVVLPASAGAAAFAVVLDGIGAEADLRQIVARLRAEMAEPFAAGLAQLQPRLRLGAVWCAPGAPAQSAEAVLRQGDAALAAAAPGDWVLHDASATPQRQHAQALQQRLEQALAGDGLVLQWDTQVDLDSGAVCALGARLAWGADGERLDLDTLAATCQDGAVALARADALLARTLALAAAPFLRWQAVDGEAADGSGREQARLALPVERLQVQRAGWADELAAMLQAAALPPTAVMLELPPSLPVADRNVIERLRVLAGMGCTLALDRFGTGAASLSVLERLPLALVKIDRGFVQRAHEVEHHRVLLEATMRVARTLGVATLAQGLDTPEALALVQSLRCEQGEGAAALALLEPGQRAGLPVQSRAAAGAAQPGHSRPG